MVYYSSENEFKTKKIKAKVSKKAVEVDGSESNAPSRLRRFFTLKRIVVTVLCLVLLVGGYFLYKTNENFDKMTGGHGSLLGTLVKSGSEMLQGATSNQPVDRFKRGELARLNVLLLGIRGEGDPNGGLLTDTIMVLSLDQKTKQAALISIPRDLYVEIPNSTHRGKINEAYAEGITRKNWQEGLKYSKESVQMVTGLDIHYVANVDFLAFEEIIDSLGGVTVHLDKPFSEKEQFTFDLPAGDVKLDGRLALLYSRARKSSSDFDRARRQQELLLAIKDKATSLGIISNPVKIMSIMDSLGNHVRTDAETWEIKSLVEVATQANVKNMKHRVFDDSPNGFLYASKASNGAYILLPEGGKFNKIQEACQNIFVEEQLGEPVSKVKKEISKS